MWLTDGPRRIFNDIDATGDVLRFTRNVQKITGLFKQIIPLNLLSNGISGIVDFINARDLFGRVFSLVSGEAARENPLGPHLPNILNVAKTFCTMIQDTTSSLSWLVSIKMLGEWVTKSTAKIVSWGKPFVVIDGVCDVSCIAGGLLSIADSLRLIAKDAMEGHWSPSRCINRCFDVAVDVCSVASAVLNNIPGVSALFVYASSAVGATLSLGKFFKKQYFESSLPSNGD